MAGLKYTYIPLETATLIQRKHPRDIDPPGLVTFNNLYVSRSDKNISLRPDFDVSDFVIRGFADTIQEGSESISEYVNSVAGLYGGDNLIFFCSLFPVGLGSAFISEGGDDVYDLVKAYRIITASTTASLTDASSSVIFSDTNDIVPYRDIWNKCLIRFNEDSTYYWLIDSVDDSNTISLYETIDDGTNYTISSDDTFEVYQTHSLDNAGYKFNIQAFGSSLVYNSPTLDAGVSTDRITGPFYSTTTISPGTDNWTLAEDLSFGTASVVQDKFLHNQDSNSSTDVYACPLYTKIGHVTDPTATTISTVDMAAGSYCSHSVGFDSAGNQFIFSGSTFSGGILGSVFLVADTAPYGITEKASTAAYSFTCGAFDSTARKAVVAGSATGVDITSVYVYDVAGDSWTGPHTVEASCSIVGIVYVPTLNKMIAFGRGSSSTVPKAWYSSSPYTSWTAIDTSGVSGIGTIFSAGVYDDTEDWLVLFNCNKLTGSSGLVYYGSDSTGLEYVENGPSISGSFPRHVISDSYSWTYNSETVYDKNLFVSSSGGDIHQVVVSTGTTVSARYIGVAASASGYANGFCAVPSSDWLERKYLSLSIDGTTLSSHILTRSGDTGATTLSDVFRPLSTTYRARAFSILDGYLVLFGVAEYDSGSESWTYTPRRVRWTAPNAMTDFSGTGSGTGDVAGNGEFLDARPVNGRIVTFETSSIGSLVPRGFIDDPWDYEVIHENIRILSNPVAVKDQCYFIASDGLLYVTNGIAVEEAGSSFDITEYDDFDENKPIWLVYSSEFNALVAFYPSGSNDKAYMINLSTGSVSSLGLAESSDASAQDPKSIVAVETSSDQRVFVSHEPSSSDTDRIIVSEMSTGSAVTGIDSFASSGDDHYWYGELQTGNIFLEREGVKVALKHIIINTYTDSSVVDDNPDLIVEVQSIEDSSWNGSRDTFAEDNITITDAACTIDSSDPPSAFSNLLGTADGTAITYALPWIAANCRVYTKTGTTYTLCTLVTDTPDAANEYQITDTQEIKVYGTTGHEVYCYCENEPFVRVEEDDYVESDEGLHRITDISSYVSLALDRYKASGSDTDCVHLSAEQMPVGHGEVKIGINRLVEGVRLRIRVAPRHASQETDQPTVAKITGISLGYMPLGEKILEATGG